MMSTAGGRWLMVSIDLPSRSKAQRRSATRFSNWLVDFGYARLHEALYVRYLPPRARLVTEVNRVAAGLPPQGAIVVVDVSDASMQRSVHVRDNTGQPAAEAPELLVVY